jgi:hypothetical protein
MMMYKMHFFLHKKFPIKLLWIFYIEDAASQYLIYK